MQSEDSERKIDIPLGLSLRSNSHRRLKRGLKGITKAGIRSVRNSAHILHEAYGLSRLSLLTLTLPNVTTEESADIGKDWSRVVKVFLQSLARCLVKRGLPPYIVSVTEIQEKRFERDGVLGLHLHLIFVGRRKGGAWALRPDDIKKIWKSALASSLWCHVSHYDWSAVEKIERIKYNASAYIAKYMTKGVKTVEYCQRKGFGDCLPATWYNLSSQMRQLYKRKIIMLSRELAEVFVELIESNDKALFEKSGSVTVRIGERDVGVGYWGKVTVGMYKELRMVRNA